MIRVAPLLFCLSLTSVAMTSIESTTSTSADLSPLRPVPFTQVKIADKFWAPRRETNRTVSIPHSFDMLDKSGNLHDLDLAASGARTGYKGPVFIDSDLYKAIEAASYSLAAHPDPELEKRVDAIIAKIAAAQAKDGYLNTWYQVNEPDKRWTNLRDNHELYCAGHLFEAAAAHYRATGKKSLLDVATKYADYIDSVFGNAQGKRPGYCGHPEIELALVKLADVTGNSKYFDLSRFFIETRGSKFFATEHKEDPSKYDGSYWQDNVPIRDHNKIVGHAVRATYLLSGATDIALRTRDAGLVGMLRRVWNDTVFTKTYLTGGIGSSAKNEGFTTDYDLPNDTAYQETCASIAFAQWNWRMALLLGDSRYTDAMERALYNGALAGVSLDGTRFFYVNPLANDGDHHRTEWFGCACCPPNITRTLAQLGGYAYAAGDGVLAVNMYIAGSVEADLGSTSVSMEVQTDYPWDGKITLKPTFSKPGQDAEIRVRIPDWAEKATMKINGESVSMAPARGYVPVKREWKAGDVVELTLPMDVKRIGANPAVRQDVGLLAIQRGPLVYCVESPDNGMNVGLLAIPADAKLETRQRPDLLGGVTVLECQGLAKADADWSEKLYAPARESKPVKVTAIPYYAWANRGPSSMRVWLPTWQ